VQRQRKLRDLHILLKVQQRKLELRKLLLRDWYTGFGLALCKTARSAAGFAANVVGRFLGFCVRVEVRAEGEVYDGVEDLERGNGRGTASARASQCGTAAGQIDQLELAHEGLRRIQGGRSFYYRYGGNGTLGGR